MWSASARLRLVSGPAGRLLRTSGLGCVGGALAVALDVEFEDVGAVDEAVDGGQRHGVAAEDPAPAAERANWRSPERVTPTTDVLGLGDQSRS